MGFLFSFLKAADKSGTERATAKSVRVERGPLRKETFFLGGVLGSVWAFFCKSLDSLRAA